MHLDELMCKGSGKLYIIQICKINFNTIGFQGYSWIFCFIVLFL